MGAVREAGALEQIAKALLRKSLGNAGGHRGQKAVFRKR